MKTTTLIIVGLVVVLGGGFATIQALGGGTAGAAAAVTTVDTATVAATVSATGNLVPAQQFTLNFANPGRLVELDVKPGDKVTNGQVLAKIDDRSAQDEVAKTAAALDDANVRLSHDGRWSESLTADRLGVATTSADLHAAQRALDDTTLVAPADALVASVSNRPGELVGAGAPAAANEALGPATPGGGFIALSDVTSLPVRAAFSEADSARIKEGQSAQITFDALAGRTVEGKVSTVLTTPTVVNNVVTYPVTVVFPLFDGARPGMTANVTVSVDKRESVLVVPNAAIATVGEFTEVVVVKGDTQAYRPIKIGLQGDAMTEVVSGLAPGERILDKPVAHESDGDVIPPPVPGAQPKAGK